MIETIDSRIYNAYLKATQFKFKAGDFVRNNYTKCIGLVKEQYTHTQLKEMSKQKGIKIAIYPGNWYEVVWDNTSTYIIENKLTRPKLK